MDPMQLARMMLNSYAQQGGGMPMGMDMGGMSAILPQQGIAAPQTPQDDSSGAKVGGYIGTAAGAVGGPFMGTDPITGAQIGNMAGRQIGGMF